MENQNQGVIPLFGNNGIEENTETNYSKLLEGFIQPFEQLFPKKFSLQDVFEFASHAWNMAVLRTEVPKKEFEKAILSATMPKAELRLLKKLMFNWQKNFSAHTNCFNDVEVLVHEDRSMSINVSTQLKEDYLLEFLRGGMEFSDDDFKPGYINRSSLTLIPKQAFYDWINALYPKTPLDASSKVGSDTFLVSEINGDPELWIKKHYDQFFCMYLDDWHTHEKDWPQKRTFALFKKWFTYVLSDAVFDTLPMPVTKSE